VILADTGPIVAVINDRDDHHRECRHLLERLPGPHVDSGHRGHRGVPAAGASPGYLRGAGIPARCAGRPLRADRIAVGDLERVTALVEKYDDLPLGTVDASVIALAERLNTTVVTLDRRDFSVVRPAYVPALTLLP
jgi:uncharacterized protein